jgi:hypothetical protein
MGAIVKKIFYALVMGAAFLMLPACSELSAMVQTATTAGAANEKVASSNIIAADKLKAQTAADQFCTMTVTTLAQNPQWLKGVENLCWTGQTTTASAAAEASIGVTANPAAIPTKAAAAATTAPASP